MDEVRNALAAKAGTASFLNFVAGIWLILSPFVLRFADLPVALWNTLAVGVAVLVVAAARTARPAQHVALSWVNCALGIWLIAAPFILHYSMYTTAMGNDVIVGALVGLLALWSVFLATPVNRPVG